MGDVVKVNGHRFVTFDLAIIPEGVLIDSPVCPHCDSPKDFHDIDFPITRFMESVISECVDCSQMILTVTTPEFKKITKPVITRWTVEDGFDAMAK